MKAATVVAVATSNHGESEDKIKLSHKTEEIGCGKLTLVGQMGDRMYTTRGNC